MKRLWLLPLCTIFFATPVFSKTNNAAPQSTVTPSSSETAPANDIMSDEYIDALTQKTNAYVNLLNRSSRGLTSWERYTKWVDLKKGITGKERNVAYGLFSLYDDVIKTIAPKALEAADSEPKIPALDHAVQDYVKTLEILHPLVSEADGYYERQDYRDDKFVKAKEMHPKLVSAFQAFIAARQKFDAELTPVKAKLDDQILIKIEKNEGKKFAWHKKSIFMLTSRTLEQLNKETISQTEVDDLVKKYADAVREFDDYMKSATDKKIGSSAYESRPANVLKNLRDFRDSKKKKNKNQTNSAYSNAIREYNFMVTFGN